MAITTSDPDNLPNTPRPALSFGTAAVDTDTEADGTQSLRVEFPSESGTGGTTAATSAKLSEYYRGAGIVPDVLVIPGSTAEPNEYGSDTLIEFGALGPGEEGFGEYPINIFYAWKVKASAVSRFPTYGFSAGDLLFAWGAPGGFGNINFTFKVANGQVGTGYAHTDGFTYTTGQSASSQRILEWYGDGETGNEGGSNNTAGPPWEDVAWLYNQHFERYYIRRKETEVNAEPDTVKLNQIVPKSGSISFSQLYGAANIYTYTISTNTQEADIRALAVTSGWDQNAKLRVVISSGVYVWSNNTNTPALKIDGSFPGNVLIENYGYIIGKGGKGGFNGPGGDGGPAVKMSITSDKFVQINNKLGAYIAGGGGGGSGGSSSRAAGGGGGAGGGDGGPSYRGGAGFGAGGAIGLSGSNAANDSDAGGGKGGGAGGSGGGHDNGSGLFNDPDNGPGGGGGRILPGVGGTSSTGSDDYEGGLGGSAGSVGGNAPGGGAGGGGGGWGASGGNSGTRSGGAGGFAIERVSGNRGITNNGVIYGSVSF